MGYKSFAAGYLVKEGKVLLVHHRKFNKWTPPGGHIEENETPDQTLVREYKEELGLGVKIIPAHSGAFAGDNNATPIPLPFHMDLEREGFDTPRIGFFFYVRLASDSELLKILESEILEAKWFAKDQLQTLGTFNQVKALAAYAIDNYPTNL